MNLKRAIYCAVVVLAAIPGLAAAQTAAPKTVDAVVDRIVAQEKAEMQMLHQYSPLVETYIQLLKPDDTLGTVPGGDKYFLGKADLGKGLDLMPLSSDKGAQNTKYAVGGLGSFLAMSMEFLPKGFLQMIYVDTAFDKQHYKFEYVRQEFLGEVRCLVFDITPVKQNDRGRFEGRLWVEDKEFHIVRFNGAYEHPAKANYFFHFDSWRVFAGDNQWLPAYVYCEETNLRYGVARKLMFKAQTRLWGYDLSLVRVRREQELNKVLVESRTPVKDADENHDYSPIQEQRLWERQAEDNVADRMEKLGVLAPAGDVDKVLVTVVNNLIVTNNLDIEPEVRCRVLMTSTLESFDLGHTIVLSRGLIDVLPDEGSLATILAMELSHIVLGHRIDTQYAFYDRMLWDDQDTFRHFGFARTPEEENAANTKAVELLANSPYKAQLAAARQFVQVLQTRSKEIPNLISAHLGDRVPTTWSGSDTLTATQTSAQGAPTNADGSKVTFAALPLGGRLKFDPWSDEVELLKAKPVGTVAEREKMPFEITPFILYLTRDKIAPVMTAAAPPETAGSTTANTAPVSDAVNSATKTQQ